MSKAPRPGVHARTELDGALAFWRAFLTAPEGTETEIRIGYQPGKEDVPYVIVAVGGTTSAFSPKQARTLARIGEDALNRYGRGPQTVGFPDLIVYLRHAADEAEKPG